MSAGCTAPGLGLSEESPSAVRHRVLGVSQRAPPVTLPLTGPINSSQIVDGT